MPDYIKFPLVLIIVSLISAVSLTALKGVTEPQRIKLEASEKEASLKVVVPQAEKFEDVAGDIDGKPFNYKKAVTTDGTIIGYVSEGEAAGYSSVIKVMVGVDKEFKVLAIKVLSQKETPGLGDKINEVLSKKTLVGLIMGKKYDEEGLRPWFQVQFDGKTVPVKVQKDGGDIEVITGATISSRAVCEAVDLAISNLKLALKAS